jgi:hypothetical protein
MALHFSNNQLEKVIEPEEIKTTYLIFFIAQNNNIIP